MDRHDHWEHIYKCKPPKERSWFQPRPEVSLALIQAAGCAPSARIIDVGGGTSRLVDELIAKGFSDVSVLDIAPSALEETKHRLGQQADIVRWIEADITSAVIEGAFDLWHDRAVFHFLTEASDRAGYVRVLRQALDVGGHAIIATFSQDGPRRCSGLRVVRYDPNSLLAELGGGFNLVETRQEIHQTPAGRDQSFVYCLFRLKDSPSANAPKA